MKLVDPTLLDILYVVHHMRDWDQREVFAARFDDDPDRFAVDLWNNVGELCWVAGQERAIAVIGAKELFPGAWSALMIATDEFPKIGLPLTRFVRRRMIPAIQARGARWGDCRSIEGHQVAHQWLEALGAKKEDKPLSRYGKNGEDFYRFVWEF